MSKIISDWRKFEKLGGVRKPEARANLIGAVQAFMLEPEQPAFKRDIQNAIANVQAFGTTADFPTSVLDVMRKYQLTTYYDNAYEQVFEIRDMLNMRKNGFEILDVQDALSFSLVPSSMKAKVYGMSGEKATVTLDKYGGGLSWDRILFDDEEYWTIENNAVAFRNKWYSAKAANFYALIEAVAAAQNIAWQAPDPAGVPATNENYTAIRDIQTINLACQTILLNCRNKGYGITPATPFIILSPIQFKGRLSRALGLVQQPFAGSVSRTYYNVSPVYTLGLTATDVYYVILPKQKLVGGNRMNLTIFSKFDELSYTDIAVGWGRYGGAIGDSQQIQRCATA
jgi:hypothetical protein